MTETPDLGDFAEAQRLHGLRRERDRLKAELRARDEQLTEALGRLAILEGVDALAPRPPKWTTPKKVRSSTAAVVAMLSDTHWDIVVRPEDLPPGVDNAYGREIAIARTRSWATQLAQLPARIPACDVAGLVLLWGGDMLNGPIDAAHMVGSDDTILGSLLAWSEIAAAAINQLADAYGRVHVVAVTGNHGRLSLRVRHDLRARDSLDHALAHLVARHTHSEAVTWQIGESADAEFELFDSRHVLTHGDQAKGGGGIGGIWPPLMRLVAKKQQRQAAIGRAFQTLWMGHWHQATFGAGDAFVVNGSLIGPTPFDSALNVLAQPPEQVATIVTPAGIEWRTTIRPEG